MEELVEFWLGLGILMIVYGIFVGILFFVVGIV